MSELSRGLTGVIVADALLGLGALVFYFWPKALPIPNLDVIFLVIALVAAALTIIGFAVTCLNKIADQNTG